MDLHQQVDSITSRDDLVRFISQLKQNRDSHPDEWENYDLSRYLDALAAWMADMDGWFSNRGETIPDQPSWQLIGAMLLAAKIYE